MRRMILVNYKIPWLHDLRTRELAAPNEKQTMKLGWACILLTLAAVVQGDTGCSGTDVTALRDTLRQSACKLVPGRGNDTQTREFRENVYKKHGQSSSKSWRAAVSVFDIVCLAQTPFRSSRLPTSSVPARL